MNCQIRMAREQDAEEIAALYHSLIGSPGCNWNEFYPTIEDVESDMARHALYCLCDGQTILGAAAAGSEEELDELDCWNNEIKNPCALSRIGIKTEVQGNGLAAQLLRQIEADAVKRGFDGIRFLVSKTNTAALALYHKFAYQCCGEAFLWDWDWFCYEKKL